MADAEFMMQYFFYFIDKLIKCCNTDILFAVQMSFKVKLIVIKVPQMDMIQFMDSCYSV